MYDYILYFKENRTFMKILLKVRKYDKGNVCVHNLLRWFVMYDFFLFNYKHGKLCMISFHSVFL